MEAGLLALPDSVDVIIEVPRGSFVKRGADGRVDYVAPLPCPFNYGSVIGVMSPDGDPLDAVVLGPRLAAGHTFRVRQWGHVDFVDAGEDDPKLVCTLQAPPTPAQWRAVERFFRLYARCKAVLNRARRRRGATWMRGSHR
jgi:inorganic pyrophosphatase